MFHGFAERGNRSLDGLLLARFSCADVDREKKAMEKKTSTTPAGSSTPAANGGNGEISEALKKKDREREARAASRRRVRGGAPSVVSSRETGPAETLLTAVSQQDEAIIACVTP